MFNGVKYLLFAELVFGSSASNQGIPEAYKGIRQRLGPLVNGGYSDFESGASGIARR